MWKRRSSISHKLKPAVMDARLRLGEEAGELTHSNALILNIDYPLGLAAYDILAEVSAHVGSVPGVYIMGKAATLNGVIGDVMISNVVHDEHSQNTYLFPNCFSAADVAPDLRYGTVLDNQKSVTFRVPFCKTPVIWMCSTGKGIRLSKWKPGRIFRQSTKCSARRAIQ